MTSPDPVRTRARAAPDAAALVHGGGRWSWAELDRRVTVAARRLRGAVPEPGGDVAMVLENGPAAVVLLHAAARASLRSAPLSPRLTPRELADAFRALDLRLVVHESGTGDAVREAVGRTGAPWPTLSVDELRRVSPRDGDPEPLPDDRVRTVLWTSGTTGRPRGVLLTGANLRASARAAVARLGLSEEDRWHASLSVAHVGGLALVTRAAFLGSTLVVSRGFDAGRFLDLARAGDVSHASFVPVMLRRVLASAGDAAAPVGLRCVLLGGAAAPRALLERALSAGWPVALTYGQTEAASQVATAPPERVRAKPGTVGRPLDGVDVRVAPGPDGAEGEGEVRVRGATVAAGYLGGESLPLDGEGWLRTGDLGRLDDDGDLWITGRLGTRIVSGGVNVDPAEVEDVLRELPEVTDAVVVGLPDPEWGELVAAAVVVEGASGSGTGRASRAVRERLDAHVRRRLAGPKRPRRVRVVPALPRTSTGKVDRRGVRALLEAGDSATDP